MTNEEKRLKRMLYLLGTHSGAIASLLRDACRESITEKQKRIMIIERFEEDEEKKQRDLADIDWRMKRIHEIKECADILSEITIERDAADIADTIRRRHPDAFKKKGAR